ncbi:MAG: hypothetical protein JRJ03_12145 [Deltaproteobacteria bacterium]|nr:hypothetical protein [Deltaproteobacteria bacterium]
MNFLSIFANLRIQDLVDIIFLTVVAYHLHLWFRGRKAFKALVGLLVLGIVFTLARTWGLFLTTWVFQILWQVLIILLIILFQSEIRQVLERVNPLKAIGLRKEAISGGWIEGLSKGIMALARYGRRVFPITRDQIFLPNDRIQIVRIEPTQISFKFKEGP